MRPSLAKSEPVEDENLGDGEEEAADPEPSESKEATREPDWRETLKQTYADLTLLKTKPAQAQEPTPNRILPTRTATSKPIEKLQTEDREDAVAQVSAVKASSAVKARPTVGAVSTANTGSTKPAAEVAPCTSDRPVPELPEKLKGLELSLEVGDAVLDALRKAREKNKRHHGIDYYEAAGQAAISLLERTQLRKAAISEVVNSRRSQVEEVKRPVTVTPRATKPAEPTGSNLVRKPTWGGRPNLGAKLGVVTTEEPEEPTHPTKPMVSEEAEEPISRDDAAEEPAPQQEMVVRRPVLRKAVTHESIEEMADDSADDAQRIQEVLQKRRENVAAASQKLVPLLDGHLRRYCKEFVDPQYEDGHSHDDKEDSLFGGGVSAMATRIAACQELGRIRSEIELTGSWRGVDGLSAGKMLELVQKAMKSARQPRRTPTIIVALEAQIEAGDEGLEDEATEDVEPPPPYVELHEGSRRGRIRLRKSSPSPAEPEIAKSQPRVTVGNDGEEPAEESPPTPRRQRRHRKVIRESEMDEADPDVGGLSKWTSFDPKSVGVSKDEPPRKHLDQTDIYGYGSRSG
ncbi:hypothetical protein CYMTET_54744 [Cymbomonas tetramitiformis]|uniref:Uncharacterized protein n=1 Tax=Cymbomonas tetramitiformis TaxID=36881 RepID=A0AAE0BFI2_9CHLO|nr:hypothetical protein CYMTET_54744 [Cymbomonas tetramitiformis]